MGIRRLLLGLLLLFGSGIFVQAAPRVTALGTPSPVRLLSITNSGMTLEFTSPDYTLTQAFVDGNSVQRINMAGAEATSTPGLPELPYFTAALGVPSNARLTMRVLNDQQELLAERVQLPSVAEPAPQGGEFLDGLPQPFIQRDPAPNPTIAYPSVSAEIADDAWLRDQRVIRFAVYPFQYTAATGTVVWHRQMQVEITWPEPAPQPGISDQTTLNSAQPFEAALEDTLLNYRAARAWRQPVRSNVPQSAQQNTAAARSAEAQVRYKIVVDRDGLYQLRYTDLQVAGMAVDTIDPRTFRLSSQSQDIAIYVSGEADGRFDAQDGITFYGEQYRERSVPDSLILDGQLVTQDSSLSAMYSDATTYTDENVYWLTVGGAAGPRITSIDGTPSDTAPVPTSYRTTVRAEEAMVWWTRHFTNRDVWFWERIGASSTTTRTYPINLTAIAADGAPAIVRGEVMSRQSNPGVDPDHHTRVALNDPSVVVEDLFWDGLVRHRFEGQALASDLREGTNNLLFTVQIPAGIGADNLYFDWFEIEYDRRFEANNNQLVFTGDTSGRWQYQVTGFDDAELIVFDITNTTTPRLINQGRISTDNSGYSIAFEAEHTGGARYAVAGASGVQRPKQITKYIAPSLRSTAQGADYLIITHRNFMAPAQDLANYRAAQGLRTRVIDIDDIYNEFNDGIYHPVAIKRFLAYAYAYWQAPAPTYVVLIGDGSWNPKMYNPAQYGSTPVFMPPNLAWVDPWLGETDSANLLASIVGDDIVPDVVISRIPVNTAAELQAVVAKTKRYEAASAQPWQQRLLFIADNTPDPAGDFEALSDAVINEAVPPDLVVDRLYLTQVCGTTSNAPSVCPEIKNKVVQTLNQDGALFVNYVGHASIDWWASEEALTNSSVNSLTNGDKLPIMLSMTCLDGYWMYPNRPSLIEEFIRADDRGAVAAFSPTGYGVANGHDILHRGFYDALFKQQIRTLGPATVAAKLQLFAAGGHDDLINTFTVFGDPALRLPLPKPTSSPEPTPTLGPIADRRFIYMPVVSQRP